MIKPALSPIHVDLAAHPVRRIIGSQKDNGFCHLGRRPEAFHWDARPDTFRKTLNLDG